MTAQRLFLIALLIPAGVQAQDATTGAYSAAECPSCAAWNAPTAPFRIFGNTWYVGTRGLGSILIAGDSGHILIDAGLPESAPLIEQSIRSLGFRVEGVRLILNSHAHYDHAGGIAALQRAAGARVAANRMERRRAREWCRDRRGSAAGYRSPLSRRSDSRADRRR